VFSPSSARCANSVPFFLFVVPVEFDFFFPPPFLPPSGQSPSSRPPFFAKAHGCCDWFLFFLLGFSNFPSFSFNAAHLAGPFFSAGFLRLMKRCLFSYNLRALPIETLSLFLDICRYVYLPSLRVFKACILSPSGVRSSAHLFSQLDVSPPESSSGSATSFLLVPA